MNREEALNSVKSNVENGNLVKHVLATEVIMRALAQHFGEDEETWGLTGLMHDIDVELTQADMNTHSKLGADLVREIGASEEVIHAVLSHNQAHGVALETRLDKALFCTDPLTGLITAAALVRPDKKLAGLEIKSLAKKFRTKGFAVGANREQIASCRDIDLELDELMKTGLKAMKSIADELGL